MTDPELNDNPAPQRYDLPSDSPAILRLRNLFSADPELFWFLKDVTQPSAIQFAHMYDFDHYQYPNAIRTINAEHPIHMSLGVSTIGSDPENRLNEDAYIYGSISDDPNHPRQLLAVIDGASSQLPIAGLEKYGVSGAFYISHLMQYGFPMSDVYKQLCSTPDITARDVVVAANTWLHEQLEKIEGVNYSDAATIPGAAATFALIDFKKGNVTLAHVADTIAVSAFPADSYGLTPDVEDAHILTDNRNKPFDDETEALVTTVMEERGIPRNIAAADPRVKTQLRESFRRKINTAAGCGILNGMHELIDNNLIHEEQIDLLNLQSGGNAKKSLIIVLASDGFYSIFPTDEYGNVDPVAVADFGSRFYGTNHETQIEEVRAAFLNDPAFERTPRLKMVDDITLLFTSLGIDVDLRE